MTSQHNQEIIDRVRKRVDAVMGITVNAMSRTEDLGSQGGFAEGEPNFVRVQEALGPMVEYTFQNASVKATGDLGKALAGFMATFTRIQDFQLNHPEASPERQSILQDLAGKADEVEAACDPLMGYVAMERIQALDEKPDAAMEAAKAVEVMEKSVAANLQKTNAGVEEMEKALASARELAGEAGVSTEAVHFGNEAQIHKRASGCWLGVAGFFALLTIGFAFCTLYQALRNPIGSSAGGTPTTNSALPLSGAGSLQVALAKVAIFSVFSFVMVWSGRVYKAHRHNHVVNKHRQNALQTFNAFVSSASDDATKNTVLLEAARCIFAPQRSGYLGKQPAPPAAANRILEIMKMGQ